ncbi:MAG: ATP-binding protein, partial [Nitrosopumilus sp.]|nr:ATP-binding protein [Nitrosopumilus sp.]
ALEYSNRALARDPENAHALENKIAALNALGRREEAQEYSGRAPASAAENTSAVDAAEHGRSPGPEEMEPDGLGRIPSTEDDLHEFKEHYAYDGDFDGPGMRELKRMDGAKYSREVAKKSKGAQQRIAVAVAAFANSKGGLLYIGVDDGGSVCGLEKDLEFLGLDNYKDKLANHISDALSNYFDDELFIRSGLTIRFREAEDKTICVIHVREASRQVYVFGNDGEEIFPVRGPGAQTKRLTGRDRDDYIRGKFYGRGERARDSENVL